MVATISTAYLKKHLAEVLERVQRGGEEFIVERDGERVAKLGPPPPPQVTLAELAEQLKDVPWPDEKFADDLEQIHAEMNQMPLKLPEWPC